MCLDAVTEHRDEQASGEGWKVFIKGSAGLHGLYHGRADTYTIGLEYEASQVLIPGGGYRAGFHVFETCGDAEAYLNALCGGFPNDLVVRRVLWSERIARGPQAIPSVPLSGWCYAPCVVARFMTILPEDELCA